METSRLRGGNRDSPGWSLGTARSAANPRTPLSGVLQSFSSYSRQAAATTTRPTRFIKSGGCAASKTEPCRQSSQQERLFFFLRRGSDRTSSVQVACDRPGVEKSWRRDHHRLRRYLRRSRSRDRDRDFPGWAKFWEPVIRTIK